MTLDFGMTRDDYAESCFSKQNSSASKRSAYTALDSYDRFLKEKFQKTDDDMFIELQEIENTPKFYQFLNLYVQYLLKNNSSPGTVGTYLMHVKGYLRGRGLRIYNEDVKQYVKRPKQVRRMKKPLTREHIKKLNKVSSRRMIAFYLVCASSGLRKDEAWFLRVSDMDDSVFPVRIRVRAENTKGREERYSFITPEAYDAVKPFMEKKSDDDFIFAKVRNTGLENSIDTMFQRCRKKSGFIGKTK